MFSYEHIPAGLCLSVGPINQEVHCENIPKGAAEYLHEEPGWVCIKIKQFGGTSLFPIPHAQHLPHPLCSDPSASALLQRKASTQRRAAVTPSRLLFDVCEVRFWGTPQHGSADTAWISPSFTPLPFPTHIFNFFRFFSFHKLHSFCSPSHPGFLDLWKASICKAKSSQQSVPTTSPGFPLRGAFSTRSGQKLVGQSGVVQPVCGTGHKENPSADPVLCLCLGAGNKGKAQVSLAVSLPS